MNKKVLLIILILSTIICTVSAGTNNTSDNLSNNEVNPDVSLLPDSYFDIKIVSDEMLNNIRINSGNKAQVLKANRGFVIGIIVDNNLYLSGNLDEELFRSSDFDGDPKKEIYEHLIDITFGRDNSQTELFYSDKPYHIWLDHGYTKDDIENIQKHVIMLNNLSGTTEFEDEKIGLTFLSTNYEPVPYNYYMISIITDRQLEELIDDRDLKLDTLLKKNGKTIGIIRKDHLWLSDMTDTNERNYYFLKGILYSMGFHGESSLKDSFFASGNEDTNLSYLDMEAIKLMYGGRIISGYTAEQVEIVLGLRSLDN